MNSPVNNPTDAYTVPSVSSRGIGFWRHLM